MSFWNASPDVGDWVRTTGRRRIPTTFADHLVDGGLRPGTRGVVVGRVGWSRLDVDFDAGFGTQRATVKTANLRVVRGRGGVDEFHRRADVVGWARLGVELVLIAPFVIEAVRYMCAHGTHGLLLDLALAVVNSVIGVFELMIAAPVQTAVYLVGLTLLSRFAFGR